MKRVKKIKRLYHLSVVNCDGKVFKPRLPLSRSDDPEFEDQKTKRVCFSTSMSGAFRAISYGGYEEDMYVHIPENIEEIVKKGHLFMAEEEDVEDAYYTNEYWVTQKVRMKCIGKARFIFHENPCSWDVNLPYRERVSIKWIERYE